MPVNLYYTQKVRGFQQQQVKYSSKSVEIHLKRTKHQCPHCGSDAVTVEPIRSRRLERTRIFPWWYRAADWNGAVLPVGCNLP